MVNFICIICGYKTERKCNLKDHLLKRKICSKTEHKIDRNELVKMLDNGNQYIEYLRIFLPLVYSVCPAILDKTVDNDNIKNSATASTLETYIENYNKIIESGGSKKCSYCSKEFSTRQARWKHQSSCKHNNINDKLNVPNNIEQQVNINGNQNIVNKIEKQVNNTNRIETQINNNTNNLNFYASNGQPKRVFGDEDISYVVRPENIYRYREIAQSNAHKVLSAIATDIYCNDAYPHNHTVRINSIKGDTALTLSELPDKWQEISRVEVADKMARKCVNTLESSDMPIEDNPKYDAIVNDFYGDKEPNRSKTTSNMCSVLVSYYKTQKRLL